MHGITQCGACPWGRALTHSGAGSACGGRQPCTVHRLTSQAAGITLHKADLHAWVCLPLPNPLLPLPCPARPAQPQQLPGTLARHALQPPPRAFMLPTLMPSMVNCQKPRRVTGTQVRSPSKRSGLTPPSTSSPPSAPSTCADGMGGWGENVAGCLGVQANV